MRRNGTNKLPMRILFIMNSFWRVFIINFKKINRETIQDIGLLLLFSMVVTGLYLTIFEVIDIIVWLEEKCCTQIQELISQLERK